MGTATIGQPRKEPARDRHRATGAVCRADMMAGKIARFRLARFSLYVDYLAGRGVDLHRTACEKDLEGIVAKLAHAHYGTEPSTWVKIKNPSYSQAIRRRERFEEMRARRFLGPVSPT